MVLQYSAVGIQNESRMALTRADYWADLENLAESIKYGVWNSSLDLPVRLVAVSEGGIGGWCLGGGDEHVRICREVVPEIPDALATIIDLSRSGYREHTSSR